MPPELPPQGRDTVVVFLAGDVMLGRGVDQVLSRPGDPSLREAVVRDAREYVALAERVNGTIPRPVEDGWPWGDVLEELESARPDARVVNLETAVTRSSDFAPGKAVHYRMNPDNVGAIRAVRPDVCVLANNHVLDFGRIGLLETLDALAGAGLASAGAGRDEQEAARPALVPLPGGRLVVLAVASPTSGVPPSWAAGEDRPGVRVVGLSPRWAAALVEQVRQVRKPGDLVVVSVHWGSNWGHEIPPEQVDFAHALVDGGVDVVHGHSSHHPRAIEVYRERLVLYGCGDLVNDYEGIGGYEAYRDDLRLLYLPALERGTGRLERLDIVPLRAQRLRLRRADHADAQWLARTLTRASRGFGTALEVTGRSGLRLRS